MLSMRLRLHKLKLTLMLLDLSKRDLPTKSKKNTEKNLRMSLKRLTQFSTKLERIMRSL
jgi:hypothetical protein